MKTRATPKTATGKPTSVRNKKAPAQKSLVKTTADAPHAADPVMTNSRPLTDEIAARAYQIWQHQGCPEGREDQHWQQAEREITQGGPGASFPTA